MMKNIDYSEHTDEGSSECTESDDMSSEILQSEHAGVFPKYSNIGICLPPGWHCYE